MSIPDWTPWFRGTLQGATPQTCAAKLVHEAEELVQDPTGLAEAADVLIVLASWCVFMDIPWSTLVAAADDKMNINRARTWARQIDGTYQHVEKSEAGAR